VDNTAHRRFLISASVMVLVEIDTGDYLMAEQHFALCFGLGHWAQSDGQPA
jgi:hypothetical protein